MDFIDRLRSLMASSGDNNSTLAKKSGIPYTTIDGLFKRGWEKAQLSTIQKICEYYKVSLDYMVYGAEKLSEESLMLAGKYENLSPTGKGLVESVMAFASKYHSQRSALPDVDIPLPRVGTVHGVPLFQMPDDMRLPTKLAAKEELKELNADVQSAIKE